MEDLSCLFLIWGLFFLKIIRFWLAVTFAIHSNYLLKFWRSHGPIKKFSHAYKLHLEKKYKVLCITRRVRFLATIMHFAPRYDVKNGIA